MALEQLSPSSRLALVYSKVERAKQNLRDMEACLDEFYDSVPGSKRQIKSFKHEPGLVHTFHVPFDTLCAASDVIGNLVGAFDHLAYQLVMAHAPSTSEDILRTVYFPLAENKAGSKSRLRTIKHLIHPDAVELIKQIEPYGGGNEALALLHKLNNLSKHRLLLNVASHVMCYGPGEKGTKGCFLYILDEVYFFGIWGRPQEEDFILESGLERISEIRAGQPEALFPTLHYLIEVVGGIIKNFLPYL